MHPFLGSPHCLVHRTISCLKLDSGGKEPEQTISTSLIFYIPEQETTIVNSHSLLASTKCIWYLPLGHIAKTTMRFNSARNYEEWEYI